jgi:DNA-binding FadR family transcriptional regulator
MLGLEGQATALAATVTGLTAAPELQQFAARMRVQAGDAKRMRELMGEWHRPVPALYLPGASLPAGRSPPGRVAP